MTLKFGAMRESCNRRMAGAILEASMVRMITDLTPIRLQTVMAVPVFRFGLLPKIRIIPRTICGLLLVRNARKIQIMFRTFLRERVTIGMSAA